MRIVIILFSTLFLSIHCVFAQFDINNKIMLAQSFEQAGDYDKAISLFEEIYSIQPQNYQVFESLNRVYIQSKKYDKSISLIESKIKLNPKDVNLFGMLGSTYFLKGDEKKAFEVWEDGIKTAPDNQMHYRVIANFAMQRRAFDKAIDYLKRGKSIAQNPDIFSYDLANLYSLLMRYKDAAEEYCFLLNLQPNQLSAIENRILSYSNKPDALSQTIEVIENWRRKDNIGFQYLLARLYVEAKSFDKAYSLYIKIDEQQQNKGQELYNFAMLVYNEKEYSLSAKIYEDIINKYPQTQYAAASKLGLAKALESILEEEIALESPKWKPLSKPISIDTLKTKKVIDSYHELTKVYPNSDVAFEAYFRIGNIYFTKLNNPAKAKEYFEKILSEASLSRFAVEASNQLAKIHLVEGNLEKAKFYFENIARNGRASEENKNYANYQIARINLFAGNFSDAKMSLSKVMTNLRDNTANDAIELSIILNTASNDSSNLVNFGKAEFLTEQGRFSEASVLYNQIGSDPNAFVLHHICKLRQAEAELAMDNFDKSIELLEKITSEGEKNIYADKALYLIARIYQFGKKNIPKAIEYYEALLAKFPSSLYLDQSREVVKKLKNKVS